MMEFKEAEALVKELRTPEVIDAKAARTRVPSDRETRAEFLIAVREFVSYGMCRQANTVEQLNDEAVKRRGQMQRRGKYSRRNGGGVARSKLAKRSRYEPKFSPAAKKLLKGLL